MSIALHFPQISREPGTPGWAPSRAVGRGGWQASWGAGRGETLCVLFLKISRSSFHPCVLIMLRARTLSLFTLPPPCLSSAPQPMLQRSLPSASRAGLSHCTVPLSVDTGSERVLVVLTQGPGPGLRIFKHSGGQRIQLVNSLITIQCTIRTTVKKFF